MRLGLERDRAPQVAARPTPEVPLGQLEEEGLGDVELLARQSPSVNWATGVSSR